MSVALLLLSLHVWRRAVLIWGRERFFAIRAEMFDAAANSGALDEKAYVNTRLVINGVLRDIHHMSGAKLLFIAFMVWKHKPGFNGGDSPEASETPVFVRSARNQTDKAIKNVLWLSSIDCALAMLFVTVIGKANQFMVSVMHEAEHVGRDDEYASHKQSDRDGFTLAGC